MNKKFRAYYKPDLETPDGALKFEQVVRDDRLWFIYDEDICYEFEIPFLDDNWVVQQYLGFNDDDGNDVYEGDIVKYTQWSNECDRVESVYIRDVEISNGMIYPRPYRDECEDSWYSHGIDQYKIIGNIMENPELIDKK